MKGESSQQSNDNIWNQQNYIPDICTENQLWIRQDRLLNLVDKCSEGHIPEDDMLGTTSEGPGVISWLKLPCNKYY